MLLYFEYLAISGFMMYGDSFIQSKSNTSLCAPKAIELEFKLIHGASDRVEFNSLMLLVHAALTTLAVPISFINPELIWN